MLPIAEKFDPYKHMGPRGTKSKPSYKGSHVVTSAVPLADIDFDVFDPHAKFNPYEYRAQDCPDLSTLEADPQTNPITQHEKIQFLHVRCPHLADLAGDKYFYKMCIKRVLDAGLKPEEITVDNVENVCCPFSCLRGNVEARVGRVIGLVKKPITVPVKLEVKNTEEGLGVQYKNGERVELRSN